MPTSTLTSTPTPPEQPPVASNQDHRQRRSQSPSQARERVPSPDGTTYEDGDVEIVLRLRIPEDATPSHNIGPLFVSHRVKWDVLISNLDGHYSELRCSLPIHLLAKEVLDETLAATNATRTALLGEGHGAQQVQEVVLPAYHDHIRDRVALVELPEHALAVNPLNATAASMPTTPEEEGEPLVPLSSSYGASSTMARPSAHSDVPRVSSMPDASERGRLGRQGASRAPTGTVEPPSSELYLSLGRRPDPPTSTTSPESGSHPPSQSSSRASSPERSGDHPSGKSSRHGFSLKPFTMFKSKASSTPSSSNPGSRPGSRPGSSKGRSGSQQRHRSTFSHSSSGLSVPSSPEPLPPPPIPIPAGMPMPRSRNYLSASNSPTSTQTSAVSTAPSDYYYYDTVPDYAFAAQCFLGGGITPLSSFRGLPSYDQAQRSRAGSPQTTTVGTVDSAESSGSALAMSSSRRRSGSGNAGRRSPTTRRSNEQEQRRPSQIPE
ncbi:hypothetical protein FRC17_005677 [Serendipita sp. 399]|nr:hypothetical protein FRC17_005677 [Serendipita sp. 399]